MEEAGVVFLEDQEGSMAELLGAQAEVVLPPEEPEFQREPSATIVVRKDIGKMTALSASQTRRGQEQNQQMVRGNLLF